MTMKFFNIGFQFRYSFLVVPLFFSYLCSVNSQVKLQDKSYIYNKRFILPSTEGKIVYMSIDSLNSKLDFSTYPNFLAPLGVSSFFGESVKYCMLKNIFFSFSAIDYRGKLSEFHFVALNIDSLIGIHTINAKTFISSYKRTFSLTKDNLLIQESTEILNPIFDSEPNMLSLDFESDNVNNVYLALRNAKEKSILFFVLQMDEIPYFINKKYLHNTIHRPKFQFQFSDSSYAGSACNLAYLKDKLYVIDEYQSVFRVNDKKMTCIFQNKENPPKSADDSMIIVDKDNQALYLSSKELLKNYKGTMKDFLKLCTSVPID